MKLEYKLIGVIGFVFVIGLLAFSFNLSIAQTSVTLLIMLFLAVLGVVGIIIFVEKKDKTKYMTTEDAYEYIQKFWKKLRQEELTTNEGSIKPWTPPGSQKHFYIATLHRKVSGKAAIFYVSTNPKNVTFIEDPTVEQLLNPLEGFASEFEMMYGGVVARKFLPGADAYDRPPSQTAVYVDTGKKHETEEKKKFRFPRRKPKNEE